LARRCERARQKILDFFEEKLINEEAAEVKGEAKNQLCEGNKENLEPTLKNVDKDIKEPESPHVLPPRCLRLMQIAREVTQKNQQQEDLESKSNEGRKSNTNIESSSLSNEDSMSQLYECIQKCAIFQLEDAKQSKKDPDQVAKWALRGGEGHNAQHGASAAPMH